MHPAIQYELMQARHHDMMKSAAQYRLAAEAKAARVQAARRDSGTVAPRRRVLKLVWRLLPA